MKFLQGKKTFIVSGLMVLFAIIGFALGQLDQNQACEIFLEGLAIAGLRLAIK